MRFIVDECTGPVVARWLQQQGHDVLSVYDTAPGIGDDTILELAITENRIIVTNDKDFGDLIYREGRFHTGVILLRLQTTHSRNRVAAVQRVLERYGNRVEGNFVVVTETAIRFAHAE